MLLAIDVGNTNSVFGIFQGEKLLTHWRLSSGLNRTVDESWITVKLLCMEEGIEPSEITGVIIGSVVPNVTNIFAMMSEKYLHIDPIIVDETLEIDLEIKYDDPHQVGADRICNAVAGKHFYSAPMIILDYGTATTFDVVDASGAYLGGVIMPGFETAAKDLVQQAARLFKVDLRVPDKVIGSNTEESMQSGILWGVVDSINGMLHRIALDLDAENVDTIVTGGVAKIMLPLLESVTEYNPDLTLQGLRLIYDQVRR